VKQRVRHRIEKLTPYERTTATLCRVKAKPRKEWPERRRPLSLFRIVGNEAAAALVGNILSRSGSDEIGLPDVLRELRVPWDFGSAEQIIEYALSDASLGLRLRYDNDPHGLGPQCAP